MLLDCSDDFSLPLPSPSPPAPEPAIWPEETVIVDSPLRATFR